MSLAWPLQTHYAQSADGTHLAYAVIGEGPPDLVFAVGMATNLGVDMSEDPGSLQGYERLPPLGRLILFDQRGSGMSDPIALNDIPTVDRRVEDIEAVLDAAGSTEAIVIATASAGPTAMLLAASRPNRVSRLILYGTYARMRADIDYPAGVPDDALTSFVEFSRRSWGTGSMLDLVAPSLADVPDARDRYARFEKLLVSPAQSAVLGQMGSDVDVRDVLSAISVPTLVLHRQGDRMIGVAHGRYLAEHIPGAKLVELPGIDHYCFAGDVDALFNEIAEFIGGVGPVAVPDRVLATVLITDIVGSTDLAQSLGDARWRELLDHHDRVTRRQIDRFGGHLVKRTGDGVVATFDGPARAMLSASAIRDGLKLFGIDMRAGVHTGEVEVRGEDIGGIAVHIASRIAAAAGPGEVLASRIVRELVIGSGIEFESRGPQALKGLPEPWELFSVG